MSNKNLDIISQKRAEIGEGIYLLYFAIMIGARALGLYEGQIAYNVVLIIGMILFVSKMCVTEHTLKEYAIALFFFLIVGIVYLHTGEKGLIVCFSMAFGMKKVAIQKVISVGAIVAGLIVLVKVFLGVLGFVPEIYYPQERAGVGVMFRHALGYAHPNTLHMNVLIVSMMIVYLITSKAKEKDKHSTIVVLFSSLFVFLFNIYIFQYSGSRTGILACAVYLLINFWFFIRQKIGFFEKTVLYFSFPAVCFIAIVLPLVANERLFEMLDRTIFNSRFMLAKYFWSNNHISLWGSRLNNPDKGLQMYGIDMAQLYLFLQLGVVPFILITIVVFWFIYMCIKLNRKAELAVLLGMLFLGMWEPLLYNLGFKNFVFVFMGAMIYGTINHDYSYFDKIECITVRKTRCRNDVLVLLGSRTGITIASIAALVGIIVSLCYLLIVPEPTALYGDREENEAGYSFGMEALYLSEDQIESFEAEGDIVIGYVDETKPMYRYDDVIAEMEYEKRILSYGVWSGLLVAAIGYFVVIHSDKSKKVGKC